MTYSELQKELQSIKRDSEIELALTRMEKDCEIILLVLTLLADRLEELRDELKSKSS